MTRRDGRQATRILFVDHTSVLGGAELSLLDIATAFRDRAAVALFEDGPLAAELVARSIAVVPISSGESLRSVKKQSSVPSPSALLATMRCTFELARTARAFGLLYCNSPKSFLIGAAAGLVARRPVVWHLRDILDAAHFSRVNIRLLVTMANARAAAVVANSQATADAFIAAGGRREVVTVVHNGIDATPFDLVSDDARVTVRHALGVPADAFLVGHFSRLHPWKGQQVLLDALETLPDVHAILVGGALFSGEEAFEAELRARVARPPLAGRVRMLGASREVASLIAACDAVAHTSVLPEPFGRVLVEALLARRPVVASDAGGVREVVSDEVTALLVRPGDANALAHAIERLRDDPSLGARLAAAGSHDVRQRFTRDAMLDGVARVVERVLGAHRA